jgi:nitroimidazol reductase NimA-like FMN-containing flavoprotein (pyridoxamine 5'-phosphate oxidase superfamily)
LLLAGLEMKDTEEISELVRTVLASQRFAVLATESEGQPYSNLVAFAEADNLRSLLFVTGRDTKKYSNTIASKRVAVLVDNRTNQASDLDKAVAVTALGTIEEVAKDYRGYLSAIYLSKHPQLEDFLRNPSTALMRVAVTDYIVASFESVRRLHTG